jgi:hypothetical protein
MNRKILDAENDIVVRPPLTWPSLRLMHDDDT